MLSDLFQNLSLGSWLSEIARNFWPAIVAALIFETTLLIWRSTSNFRKNRKIVREIFFADGETYFLYWNRLMSRKRAEGKIRIRRRVFGAAKIEIYEQHVNKWYAYSGTLAIRREVIYLRMEREDGALYQYAFHSPLGGTNLSVGIDAATDINFDVASTPIIVSEIALTDAQVKSLIGPETNVIYLPKRQLLDRLKTVETKK